MLSPLHVGSSGNLESHFGIIADLLFQVVDEHGFFQSTWHLITPAMASSVLTSLMEVVARSSSRPQLMKIFHNIFNKHAQTSSSLNLGIFQLQGTGLGGRIEFGNEQQIWHDGRLHPIQTSRKPRKAVQYHIENNLKTKTTLCVCVVIM